MRSVPRYLALFALMTLPFGLVLALLLGAFAGLDGVAVGLMTGLAFGLLTTLVLGGLDVAGQRRSRGVSRSGWPRQRLVVHSEAPPEELAAVLRQAVYGLHGTTEADALPHGPLVARTGSGLASWGEEVTVELHAPPGGGGTDVVLSSRPLLSTTLVDYGKGRRNVNRLAAAVIALP